LEFHMVSNSTIYCFSLLPFHDSHSSCSHSPVLFQLCIDTGKWCVPFYHLCHLWEIFKNKFLLDLECLQYL
jgi:hypothetical protein